MEYKFSLVEGNEFGCKESEGPPNECLDDIDIPLKCLHDVNPSVFDLGRMESDGVFAETDLQLHLLGFLYERKLDLFFKAGADWKSHLLKLSNPNEWIILPTAKAVQYQDAYKRIIALLRKHRVLSATVPSDVLTFDQALQKLHQAWRNPDESFILYRDDPDLAKFRMVDIIFQRKQNHGNCVMNCVAVLQRYLIAKHNRSHLVPPILDVKEYLRKAASTRELNIYIFDLGDSPLLCRHFDVSSNVYYARNAQR